MLKKLILPLMFLVCIVFSCSNQIKLSRINDNIIYPKFSHNFSTQYDSLLQVWSYTNSSGFRNNSFIALDSILFINDLKGDVKAINLNNGKKTGEVSFKSPILSSIGLIGNYLIIPSAKNKRNDSFIHIYDILSGEEVTNISVKSSVETKILVKNSSFIVLCIDGKIFRYDRIGGTIWEKDLRCPINVSPVIYESTIYCSSDNGLIFAIDFESGKIIWQKNINLKISSGLTTDGNNLIFGTYNGELICMANKNGEIRWKYQSLVRIFATPVIDLNKVYFSNLSGEFFETELGSGKINRQINTGQIINNSPIIFLNRIFLFLQDKTIRIIDKKNLTEIKKIELDGRPKSEPFIYKDYLVLGIEDDLLICYKIL